MKKKSEIYIYLGKRDKSGVKLLGSFPYDSKVYPTKINEEKLASLNINPKTTSEILKSLRENKMNYELFLETAESLEDLKKSLRKRGYAGIPTHQIMSTLKLGSINKKNLITENSTMMRRGSSFK